MEIQCSLAYIHAYNSQIVHIMSPNCQTHSTIALHREHQVVTRRKMEREAGNLLFVLIHHLKTTVVQGQAAPVGQHILILRRRDRQERRSLKSAECNTNDRSYVHSNKVFDNFKNGSNVYHTSNECIDGGIRQQMG